ncbi:MAG: oligosaccharide flippase family protein [Clostridia bacterium]|nr:oligosaccharide flippase family protein [Clostridia bacterium]
MKNKVVANASIVTGLSIAERSLGFLYRIVLSRLIGAEGLGLYQVALSLFGLFITIGTGGIPITVSRMISKAKAEGKPQDERRAVGAGVAACLLLTLPFALLLWAFGGKMTFLFSDERGFSVFRILLLGLALSAVYAVIRGSFWGNKQFLIPSITEIAEESVMVIAGVLLLQNVASPLDGAKRAAWAVVISYLFSFALSLLLFFLRGGKISSPKNTLKPLFNASLPITSVRASTSLVTSAVAVLLPVMLVRAGFSETDALGIFGVVSGMVLPVLFVPSTVIGSLALVLVPELSEDFYKNNQKRLRTNLARGLKFSFLIACALIPFFFALGEDFGALAFSNPAAGKMIKNSCLILLPMSLTMILNAMLNSMGFEKQTFSFYFLGAAALILSILFLPRFCGGYAYLVGLFFSYVLTAAFSLLFLLKKCSISKKRWGQVFVHDYFPALFGVLPISLFGMFLHNILQLYTGAVLSVLLCAIAMFVVTLLYYFAMEEIALPKGVFKKRKRAPNAENGRF